MEYTDKDLNEIQTAVKQLHEVNKKLDEYQVSLQDNPVRQKALQEIMELEAQATEAPLGAVDQEYLEQLKKVFRTGQKPPPTVVSVQDLLANKLGPERYERYKMGMKAQAAQRELLQATNDELQRQIELKNGRVPGPFMRTREAHMLEKTGTYTIEVKDGRVVKAYPQLRSPRSLYQRFLSWLYTLGSK